ARRRPAGDYVEDVAEWRLLVPRAVPEVVAPGAPRDVDLVRPGAAERVDEGRARVCHRGPGAAVPAVDAELRGGPDVAAARAPEVIEEVGRARRDGAPRGAVPVQGRTLVADGPDVVPGHAPDGAERRGDAGGDQGELRPVA